MKARLLNLLLLTIVAAVGCQRKGGGGSSSDLDASLKAAGQKNIVVEGKTADVILYRHEKLVIWFRHILLRPNSATGSSGQSQAPGTTKSFPLPWRSDTAPSGGQSNAAIYVFSKGRCIQAIAVDAWDGPWAPTVCRIDEDDVILLSYGWGDLRALYEENRFEFRLRLHRVAQGACTEIFGKTFEVIKGHGDYVTYYAYVPFGDPMTGKGFVALTKLACEVRFLRSGPTKDIGVSVADTIRLDLRAEPSTQSQRVSAGGVAASSTSHVQPVDGIDLPPSMR